MPAQALTYRVGLVRIHELRRRCEQQMGKDFSLTAFHDELLKDGGMPLEILEKKMNAWAKKVKAKK